MKEPRSWRLYAIADPSFCRGKPLVEVMRAALRGGAEVIQLRDKEATSARLYQEALALRQLTREWGVPLIVNDRTDIALAVEADGVHLGQQDLPVPVARKLLGPDRIIGVSVHDLPQAREAVAFGADYLGVGPVYPTSTKQIEQAVGLDLIREIKENLDIPIIAIGGINPENVAEVIQGGAHGVAVISALLGVPDVTQRAREFRVRIEAAQVE